MAYRDQAEKDRFQNELNAANQSGNQAQIAAAQKRSNDAAARPVDTTNPLA